MMGDDMNEQREVLSVVSDQVPGHTEVRQPLMEAQVDKRTLAGYLFFWSGQKVSELGSSIAQFAIIWWITLDTGSALYLSMASLVGFVPVVVLGPVAGVLADRWNRKLMIGVADFLQALATVALICLFWADMASIWQVLVILALRGILQAFHITAATAIVPSMVPPYKLSRINGLNYLLSGLMSMIGPIVGSLLIGFWRIDQVLWIDAGTFAVALIPLIMTAIPSVRYEGKGSAGTSFRKEFAEGLAFIRGGRGFMSVLMTATALNFLFYPLMVLLPYYVKFVHSGGVTDLALIEVAFEGGMFIGGLLMSVIKGFKRKMLWVALGMFVAFIGYASIAFMPGGAFWFGAICASIVGLCLPVINVTIQTIIQTVVPGDIFGRVNSVILTLSNVVTPAGMILSGVMAQLIGTANLFLGCSLSGLMILTASWFFTDFRRVGEVNKRG